MRAPSYRPRDVNVKNRTSWAFNIEYVRKTLPAATQAVLFEMLEPEREHPSKKGREELHEEQAGKCEACGALLDNSEADHVAPLRDLVAGHGQHFILICPTSHGELSEPTRRRASNHIISQFNPTSYESFVRSTRPVQCVANINRIYPNTRDCEHRRTAMSQQLPSQLNRAMASILRTR